MRITQNCVDLIKHFETLELEAYPDPGSVLGRECARRRLRMRDYRKVPNWQQLTGSPWTYGYGHTKGVRQGDRITAQQAEQILEDDLYEFERDVESLLNPGMQATQGEFDALVSFAFNVGPDIDADTIPEGLGDSTLLKLFNAGEKMLAAEEFMKWVKSKSKVLEGLKRRRRAERALFLGADWRAAL